jgi:hypothetical protein
VQLLFELLQLLLFCLPLLCFIDCFFLSARSLAVVLLKAIEGDLGCWVLGSGF